MKSEFLTTGVAIGDGNRKSMFDDVESNVTMLVPDPDLAAVSDFSLNA